MSQHREDIDPNIDPETAVVLERARRTITERRFADAERTVSWERPWRVTSVVLPLLLVAGTLVWPRGTLHDRLRGIVQGICDQRHNLAIGGTVLPLDARCTGIYTGVLLTLAWLVAMGRLGTSRLPPRPVLVGTLLAVAFIGVDGINSTLAEVGGPTLYTPHNTLRLASGLGAGVACVLIGMALFNGIVRDGARSDQQVISTPVETLALFVLLVLVGIMAWNAPVWLFVPLALFSVLGAFAALTVMNLFVVALASGLRQRVMLGSQLARPAVVSMFFTVVELGVLASFRAASALARVGV